MKFPSIRFWHADQPQKRKKKREQKDGQILGSCQRIAKSVEYENGDDAFCSWCAHNGPQKLRKETGLLRRKINQDNPD